MICKFMVVVVLVVGMLVLLNMVLVDSGGNRLLNIMYWVWLIVCYWRQYYCLFMKICSRVVVCWCVCVVMCVMEGCWYISFICFLSRGCRLLWVLLMWLGDYGLKVISWVMIVIWLSFLMVIVLIYWFMNRLVYWISNWWFWVIVVQKWMQIVVCVMLVFEFFFFLDYCYDIDLLFRQCFY